MDEGTVGNVLEVVPPNRTAVGVLNSSIHGDIFIMIIIVIFGTNIWWQRDFSRVKC